MVSEKKRRKREISSQPLTTSSEPKIVSTVPGKPEMSSQPLAASSKPEKIQKRNRINSASNVESHENEGSFTETIDAVADEACLDSQDPYVQHFCKNIHPSRVADVQNGKNWIYKVEDWPNFGEVDIDTITVQPVEKKVKRLLLEEEEDTDLPAMGEVQRPFKDTSDILNKCFIEKRLHNKINLKKVSRFQWDLLSTISRYSNFVYCDATYNKWERIRKVYSLHCLNHVLKARKLIAFHDKEIERMDKEGIDPPRFQDHGTTRPRVLILVPFKNTAYRVVRAIMGYLGGQVMRKRRFEADFGPQDKGTLRPGKPEDFYKTFEGDIEEDFKIGIALTDQCLKLYTDFFKSDIIIASPLGLRFSLEKASEPWQTEFLSSIEIVVLDQAEIMWFMQNDQHIHFCLDRLNKLPRKIMDVANCEASRIHAYCFEKLSSMYRQTLIFGLECSRQCNYLMKKSRNFAGKITLYQKEYPGVLGDIHVKMALFAYLVNPKADLTKKPEYVKREDMDGWFDCFINEVLPTYQKEKKYQTLLYVSNYYDYLKLVHYFKKEGGSSVATINEYEELKNVGKARTLFFEGKAQFLLYTDRLHFYRRYVIKGVRNIVFINLPKYPHFFAEICNFMEEKNQNKKIPAHKDGHTVTAVLQMYDEDEELTHRTFGTTKGRQIGSSGMGYHRLDINQSIFD